MTQLRSRLALRVRSRSSRETLHQLQQQQQQIENNVQEIDRIRRRFEAEQKQIKSILDVANQLCVGRSSTRHHCRHVAVWTRHPVRVSGLSRLEVGTRRGSGKHEAATRVPLLCKVTTRRELQSLLLQVVDRNPAKWTSYEQKIISHNSQRTNRISIQILLVLPIKLQVSTSMMTLWMHWIIDNIHRNQMRRL